MDVTRRIEDSVAGMTPITLEEMDAIKLMNRVDTKYVTGLDKLADVLADAASEGYMVFTSGGSRILEYDSMYFDTAGLDMYLAHHNARKVRQKVRTRTYLISGLSFLEIKRKNNHGRTKKKRIEIPRTDFLDFSGNPYACSYLKKHSWFEVSDLSPSCTTGFRRITLVNPAKTERLTIDMDIAFRNARSGLSAAVPGAVIIELKQDGHAASQMKGILNRHRVLPMRMSKYCLGIALTSPGVKSNRFKERVRYIKKFTI